MRGRKPTPTEIKLARGNPGRRPVNLHAPQYDPIDPACPPELESPRAREEWQRLIGELSSRAHITTVNRGTLIAYCTQYGLYHELLDQAQPRVLGGRAHPVLRTAFQALALMQRAAAELGITPSSRSRVVAGPPTDEGDVFAQHQGARPRLARVK